MSAQSKPKKQNSNRPRRIKPLKLTALILMLIPGVALIGFIIYILSVGLQKTSVLELILAILSIIFGFIPAIFLWLNALGVIRL